MQTSLTVSSLYMEPILAHLTSIVPVSALVTITQQFWQYHSAGISQARYIFPVPARAAVCGFKMVAEDGTVIMAEVKEVEEARRDHREAIRQGYMTGLVEHVTDDSQ